MTTNDETVQRMEQESIKKKMNEDKLDFITGLLRREFLRATNIHPRSFNSLHEGYATILEEFDELWDEIKKKNPDMDNIKEEITQVGAMAIRFLFDLFDLNSS